MCSLALSSPVLCTKVAVCPDPQLDGADAMCWVAAQTSPSYELPSEARPAEAKGWRQREGALPASPAHLTVATTVLRDASSSTGRRGPPGGHPRRTRSWSTPHD